MCSSTTPLVYVITLNWNRCADTLAFLASCSQLTYPHYQLLVVDNHSTDGSPTAVASHYPQVEQLIHKQNLGFAAGVNSGIRHALNQGADFVFLANNDTLVAADMLDVLITAAQAAQAALVSPQIFYAPDPQQVWSAGGWLNPLLLEILQRPTGILTGPPIAVDFITACGMLISQACLRSVGLFDERFFMYYEDLDYCLRVGAAGYPILVAPQAHMWHQVAASSGGSDSPNERYWMARSSVLYFGKHARLYQWPLILAWRGGSALRMTWRLGRNGRLAALKAYWRGLWHGIRQKT